MKKATVFLVLLMLFVGQQLSAQQNEAKTMAAPEKKVMIVYGSDECHHCIDTKNTSKKTTSSLCFTTLIRTRKPCKKCCSNSKKPISV